MTTPQEKAILQGIADQKGDPNKIVAYLGKLIDSKTIQQLSRYSLEFRVAIVEALGASTTELETKKYPKIGEGEKISQKDIINTQNTIEANQENLKAKLKEFKELKTDSISRQALSREILETRELINEGKEYLRQEKEQPQTVKNLRKVGAYGNKMFAAFSSKEHPNELAPLEEMDALQKNPNVVMQVNQHIQKVAARMTPSNCESQLRLCINAIAKLYGINSKDTPVLSVAEPGKSNINPKAAADAANGKIRFKTPYFFEKGKIKPDRIAEVVEIITHEEMHTKDQAGVRNYKLTTDAKIPLFQQLLSGQKTQRQPTIYRLMIAADNLENYTKSESLEGGNGSQLHDNNPYERRAIMAAQTYSQISEKIKQEAIQKLNQAQQAAIEKQQHAEFEAYRQEDIRLEKPANARLDQLACFADSYFVALQRAAFKRLGLLESNVPDIDVTDPNYQKLSSQQQKLLSVVVSDMQKYNLNDDPTWDISRQRQNYIDKFTHQHLLEGNAIKLYEESVTGTIIHKQSNVAAIDNGMSHILVPMPSDSRDSKRHENSIKNLSQAERDKWENVARHAGFAGVMEGGLGNWLKHRIKDELRHTHITDPSSHKDKLPPLLISTPAPLKTNERKIHPTEALRALDQDSKRVALKAGMPIKTLEKGEAANHLAEGSLKGRVAKTAEVNLTTLPVPELAAAAHTQRNAPRAPGMHS